MIYHILENFKYGKSSEFLYCNIFANIYPVGSYNSDSGMFLCVIHIQSNNATVNYNGIIF